MLLEPEPTIEPHAENGQVVSAEYDLSESPAPPPSSAVLERARSREEDGALTDRDEQQPAPSKEAAQTPVGMESDDPSRNDETSTDDSDDTPQADDTEAKQGDNDGAPNADDDEPRKPVDDESSSDSSDVIDSEDSTDSDDDIDSDDDVDIDVSYVSETDGDSEREDPTPSSDEDEPDDDDPETEDVQDDSEDGSTDDSDADGADDDTAAPQEEEPQQSEDDADISEVDPDDDEKAAPAAGEKEAATAAAADSSDRPSSKSDAATDGSAPVVDSSSEESFFDEGDELHEFDDDFEESFQQSTGSWHKPALVAALFALAAIAVSAVVIIDGDEPDPAADETTSAVEPDEADDLDGEMAQLGPGDDDETDDIIEDDQEADEPDEALEGLNAEQAESEAGQLGTSVTFGSEALARNIGIERQQREAEEQDEEPAEEPAEEEPADEPTIAEDDTPDEPAGPSIDEEINELRSLVQRDDPQALSLGRELSNREQSNSTIAYLHGQAAYEQAEDDEALTQFNRAESLGFQSPELYLSMGHLYRANGQDAQAREAYQQFLEGADDDHPQMDFVEGVVGDL